MPRNWNVCHLIRLSFVFFAAMSFCFVRRRKDEAAALYLRCAEAWVHADEPGRAADYFGRSAKLVKDSDEDAAAERYIFASKVILDRFTYLLMFIRSAKHTLVEVFS